MSDSISERNPLDLLAEEFVARFRRGERPSLAEYTSRYPELAAEIRDLFPALVMLEDVRPDADVGSSAALPPSADSACLERLGDYRILREVGRGGMGIVYEAEQESLGRYVALKVLPRHALLDPRQLQRFQREARAAARLHHTNIVPVFGVGEENGLHYYVMQFIHGQGLDQVLAVLRQLRQQRSAAGSGAEESARKGPVWTAYADAPSQLQEAAAVASSLLSGVFATPNESGDAARPAVCAKVALQNAQGGEQASFSWESALQEMGSGPRSDVPAVPQSETVSSAEVRLPGDAGQETLSDSGRPYWRSVANIGIQVAEALAYAHGQGILHRDIKPSNLLLDTQGVVWVTDFGLAKTADSEDLTSTGDIVGTLRYMAPERFRCRADARSDLYALGLTLYELLTLRPAFEEGERHQLLHRLFSAEPPPPRKLNPAIPRDLETIVLKAMAPDPAHRYPGAAEMAADLRRFMDDRPIQARPVSEVEKLWRWCRRNPTLAIQAGLLLLSLVLGIIGVSWKWREAEQQRAKVEDEQKRTSSAEKEARDQRDKAVKMRNAAQHVSADVLLDRGIALARQGEVGSGLLWMLEALRAAPEDATDLQRVIRINLAAWLPQSHTLRQVVEKPQPVYRCVFHPDGRRFLTQRADGSLHWYDTDTGRLLHTVVRKGEGSFFALSPDGSRLALPRSLEENRTTKERTEGNKNERIQLCDAATDQPIGAPIDHPGEVGSVAFTPDGTRLVTAGRDGTIRLWEVASARLLRPRFEPKIGPISRMVISSDGKTLATAMASGLDDSLPGVVYLWSLNTGKPLGPPLQHRARVTSLCFSPDGKRLVTGCADNLARIWDAATGQLVESPLTHSGVVAAVGFTPDGLSLLTGGDFGVRLWDRFPKLHFCGPLPIHWVDVRDLAVSPDGKVLVVASEKQLTKGAIHVCAFARSLSRPAEARRESALDVIGSRVRDRQWFQHLACYSADAAHLLVGGNDGFARLLDAATGQATEPVSGPFRHLWDAVHVTAISPRGRFFATSSRAGLSPSSDVRIGKLATGHPSGKPLPLTNYVAAMVFSPDESILATGGYDGCVRLWDPKTGSQLGPPLRQKYIVVALAFSPDGKTLAVGHTRSHSLSAGITLWDVASRKQVGQTLSGVCTPFCFSPDGRHLLSADGPTLRLWDSATGLPVGPASYEASVVHCIAFRPDGKMILTATKGGTLRLREAHSLRVIGTPMANALSVTVAGFSPDPEGRYLVAGYADGSSQLWDRATQKPLGPPCLQARAIVAATFTPDGRALLTAAEDGSSRRWPIPGPLGGEVNELALRLNVATGLEMRDGQIDVSLDFEEWNLRRQQLREQEAAVSGLPRVTPDDGSYHDVRARDAEQLGDSFAARWHLDRLIALREGDRGRADVGQRDCPLSVPCLAYARRGSQYVDAGRLDLAELDFAKVRERGSPQLLRSWYHHRSVSCRARAQWQSALWYLERAIAIDPNDWNLYADRSLAYENLGRLPESAADFERALALGVDGRYLVGLADSHARQGRWDRAAAVLNQAGVRGALPRGIEYLQALACLKLGMRDDYRRACAHLLEVVGPAPEPNEANHAAWVCALGPDAVKDYERPLALAERAVAKAATPAAKHVVLNTQGCLLYRAGRFRQAIRCLQEGIQADGGQGSPQDWAFLAMAHQRLGETTEARRFLDRITANQSQPPRSPWEALEQELLRQEAEALLAGQTTDSKK